MKNKSIVLNKVWFHKMFSNIFTCGNLRFIKAIMPKIYINQNVLDIGCGTGEGLNFLYQTTIVKHKEPGIYLGIDASPKMINYAKSQFSHIHWLQARIGNIPSWIELFDHVLCSFTFHHLSTEMKREAIKEIYQILKTGGYFMYIDYGKPVSLYSKIITNLITRHCEHIGSQVNNEVLIMMEDECFQVERKIVKTVLSGSVYCILARKI